MNRIEALHALERQFHSAENIKSIRCEDERYLLIKTTTEMTAVVFLIDSPLSTRALQQALKNNTVNTIHSLFILAEPLLPSDGTKAVLPPYLGLLQTLYHQKLYGYRVEDGRLVIFSVQLRADGNKAAKHAVYHPPIALDDFACGYIETGYPLRGFWATAFFAPKVEWELPDPNQARHNSLAQAPARGVMRQHYELLGVPYDADIEQIKQAYRQLARQYHPDYNADTNANSLMQAINQAYRELMRKFEERLS